MNWSSLPICHFILCQFVALTMSIYVRKYVRYLYWPWKHRPDQCTVYLLAHGLCINMAREWCTTATYRRCYLCSSQHKSLLRCLPDIRHLTWLQEGMAYLATGRWLKQTHSNEGTSVAPGSARQVRWTVSFNEQVLCHRLVKYLRVVVRFCAMFVVLLSKPETR